jgi:hypothetical protein
VTAGIIIRNFDGTDDTLVAVDRRLTRDGRSDDRADSKIYRGGTLVAVASGDLAQIQRLFSRLDRSQPLSAQPLSAPWFPEAYADEELDDVELLVAFREGGACHVDAKGSVIEIEAAEMETIGSGGECLAGAFLRDENDDTTDSQALSFAFRAAAYWRDDVSAEYDYERVAA